MSSEDSDDEPLSVLAAAKKLNPEKFEIFDSSAIEVVPIRKRKKKKNYLEPDNLAITIKLCKTRTDTVRVVERPTDVWLYMKDLNPTGPYSCLLCQYWFINRSKLILHYILNHKKNFCGICRYFVPEKQDWINHIKFHTPWPCSQCSLTYPTEPEMREHLSAVHNLVHCRLCHFRTTDDDQYNKHLKQKHNVTTVGNKNDDLWEIDSEGNFVCTLCTKANNPPTTFFGHYMGYHHFTLKCLTNIIAGTEPPFSVEGANVSSDFIEGQLKIQDKIGYVDIDKKPSEGLDAADPMDSNTALSLVPEIKQEVTSDNEDNIGEKDDKATKKTMADLTSYKGEEDFDITLVEFIVLQKWYFDYVNRTLNHMNLNTLSDESGIDYKSLTLDTTMSIDCSLCKTKVNSVLTLATHMSRIHSVRSVPIYSCRVCSNVFDSYNEFDSHVIEELRDFDDLWMCQFCDKEFENREETRRHLNEHWTSIEYDNCFSPHLGFKCKYCQTLFWNETDRETHQVRVHHMKHKEDFYKCQTCMEIFSDKVWFVHHYLDRHQAGNEEALYLFKCYVCSLVLHSIEEMRSHFKADHPEAKKIYCTLGSCLYRPLSQRKSLKLHLKSMHADDGQASLEGPSSCPMCGRDFTSARACGAHMSQAHGAGKFKCKLCVEVMHTMDERKLHYLIRHPGRHPFECSECGKSFQYKSSLYMHKQEHAPNKQPNTCSYCGKVFMKKDSYREHLQIHEGPRHACSYCPMRFVQRSNMLRHERRHTGERPYACAQCPRTFADKGACTSHLRTHSKDRSYACIYCGQTFVQKSKLTYHIRKHTGENLETCSVCAKLFTSACSLREHMRTHERAQMEPVQCPLCDRKYQNGRYMIRHLRTLHNQERFSCPLCPKSLTSVAGLRHHVVTHGRANMYKCKVCPKTYAVRRTLMKHLRKRHGIKHTDYNIKDCFLQLDPRDCNLPLDDDTMTKIFGAPKTKNNDIILGNFVTFKKQIKIAANVTHEQDPETDEEEEEEKDSGEESDDASKADEQEEVELEPTDFVSVKIEHVEEDEEEMD